MTDSTVVGLITKPLNQKKEEEKEEMEHKHDENEQQRQQLRRGVAVVGVRVVPTASAKRSNGPAAAHAQGLFPPGTGTLFFYFILFFYIPLLAPLALLRHSRCCPLSPAPSLTSPVVNVLVSLVTFFSSPRAKSIIR